jgi:hypothetical protein
LAVTLADARSACHLVSLLTVGAVIAMDGMDADNSNPS